MNLNNIEGILSDPIDPLKKLSEKCPLCYAIVEYLAIQKEEEASTEDVLDALKKQEGRVITGDAAIVSTEDLEPYINALKNENIVYTTPNSVGLTSLGVGIYNIEKISDCLTEWNNK